MNYPKAIFLMSGEVITITLDEEKQIKSSLMSGAEWINVQGELINSKSISKVGNHHATSYIQRIEEHQKETDMKMETHDTKKLEYTEPDYYIDKHTGEKMYS